MGTITYKVKANLLEQDVYNTFLWRTIGTVRGQDLCANRYGEVVLVNKLGAQFVITDRRMAEWPRDPGGSRKSLAVMILEAWTDLTDVPSWAVTPADNDYHNLRLDNIVVWFNELAGFAPSGSSRYRKRGITVRTADGATRYFATVREAAFETYMSPRTLERIKRGEHIRDIPGKCSVKAVLGTDRKATPMGGWLPGDEIPGGGVVLSVLGVRHTNDGIRVEVVAGSPDGDAVVCVLPLRRRRVE